MMDLLSPSATADFAERTSGPAVVQERTGLGGEDFDQLIQQLFGLQTSPAQQLTANTAMMGNLPAMLNAQTNAAEIPIKQQQADAASTTAAARQGEVDFKNLDLNTMDQEEQGQYLDTQLKTIALTGYNLQGNQVGDIVQQNAFNILRKSNEVPGLSQFITGLAANEEWDTIAGLLGISPEDIEVGIFGGVGSVKPGTHIPGATGVQNPEGVQNRFEMNRQQTTGEIISKFQELLDSLPGQNINR